MDNISFEKNTDCVIYEIEYFNNKNCPYLAFNNVDAYITKNLGMKLKIKLREQMATTQLNIRKIL